MVKYCQLKERPGAELVPCEYFNPMLTQNIEFHRNTEFFVFQQPAAAAQRVLAELPGAARVAVPLAGAA